MDRAYDVIIIGGGPAGLSAGLYAARASLSTLLIEKGILGGQIANVEHVENYPGFPEGISGFQLGQAMHQQATKYGLETVAAEVTAIELAEKGKVVKTTEGEYLAKVLIMATGAEPNRLGVPGEERLLGHGVSYCATCDGPLFRDKVVAVIGGGDSAVEEGLILTRFASKVILIHRRDQLRASKLHQQRAFANQKMEFLWDTVAEEIIGDDKVKGLSLRNVKTGEKSTLEVSGVFIYVGLHPNTEFLRGLLRLDAQGHIVINEEMQTEIAGIFAAGDIRQNSPRQVITAAGDGATASLSAEKFLSEQR
ncbi:MAG: thioredoxin-disulfide reductase [Dehalococcoidia bacterium]|jgi:thioredoxin reductase (NADPH)|nr:thioredoxin-disulfide reductase [Chloroflexota bacterium]MCK4242529.1 thioredoxin-disulfide reductase [Dehalococcoidia bacterium]